MMKKFVRVEKEEKTAIVTIDNPPLNVNEPECCAAA